MMRASLFVLIGWAICASAAAQTARPDLSNVRFSGGGDETRVVFDLSTPTGYSLGVYANPPRITVDFERVDFALNGVAEWHPEKNDGLGVGQGLVDRFRFAHNSPTVSRVVLDLAAEATIAQHFVLKPNEVYPHHRLVLDLAAVDAAAFLAAVGTEAPAAIEGTTEERPARPRVVAIDAGHGGKDPGAIGQAGTREKVVALALAKALKSALERRGDYQVIMTRDDDRLIAHGERVEIARRADADIFLSIHANALGDRGTSGSAVYTLNGLGYDRAKRQVLREDPQESLGFDLGYLEGSEQQDVQYALADLLLRDTSNQSGLLAQELLREIAGTNRLLRKPHRQENFAVLLAPDVAAVLVEAAFISNAEDERRLNSAQWRGEIAEALAKAIDAYFDKSPVL